jgi:intraflagellar transport protein 172
MSLQFEEAIHVLARFGADPDPRHFDLYERIGRRILAKTSQEEAELDMQTAISELRSTFFTLVFTLRQNGRVPKEIEQILMASHYTHIRNQAVDHGLTELSTKIALAMLKYAAVVPADKLFYVAGMACKDQEELTLAFVLLNRYIDLTEAIEDGDASMLDNAGMYEFAKLCPPPFCVADHAPNRSCRDVHPCAVRV